MNRYRTAACDDDTSRIDDSGFDEFGLDTKSRLLEVYEWLEESTTAAQDGPADDAASGPAASGN